MHEIMTSYTVLFIVVTIHLLTLATPKWLHILFPGTNNVKFLFHPNYKR